MNANHKIHFWRQVSLIKKLSFLMFIVLILLFSISTIQAEDVNVTDVGTQYSNRDITLQLDEGIQVEEITNEKSIFTDEPSLQENIKNQTQLTAPTTSMYYGGDYQVTLMDLNTNATLADKNVSFSINNINYFATTNSNGVASINLKLNPGKYLVTASFAGDDEYEASDNLSGKVNILTTVQSSDVTKYYKGIKDYQATFLDSQGRPLKNTDVKITIDGKKYIKTTNKKGIVSLSMGFKPGTYTIIASNPSNGYKLKTTFKILSTVSSSNLKKVKGDDKKFVAKFLKSNGKPLADKYINLKINGKDYKFKTNSNGKLKLSFNNFEKGTYKVITYNDGLSKKSTVQIYDIASTKLTVGLYTFLENETTKKIKIKFSTNLDDDSNAGKKIEINIDGNTYYKKTDANGVIKFKLPSLNPRSYEIECHYYGDKFFKEAHANNYVAILDTPHTKLSVKSKSLSFGYLAGNHLKVSLTAGKIPLVKKTVCFTVNGKKYNVATDYQGIASLPIKFGVGKYAVNFKSSGDNKVKGSSGSCDITVFKRTNTKFIYTIKNSYKESSEVFKFLLKDSNGKPVRYAEVKVVIDGKTYYEVTNSRGYVAVKTYLPIGKSKFSIKYKGDNNYAPSYKSSKINIAISKYTRGLIEKELSVSSDYLNSTKNCQVNDAKIKSLVNSLTKGLSNAIDKAKAIFDYVRDNIVYDYYYNSHKGALNTLTSKSANCVDQSHLLVSMFRTAGLKARYVHGKCNFGDGTYGHVWSQVLIGNIWVVADPIDYDNELGKITNWNTKSFKFQGNYLTLPF